MPCWPVGWAAHFAVQLSFLFSSRLHKACAAHVNSEDLRSSSLLHVAVRCASAPGSRNYYKASLICTYLRAPFNSCAWGARGMLLITFTSSSESTQWHSWVSYIPKPNSVSQAVNKPLFCSEIPCFQLCSCINLHLSGKFQHSTPIGCCLQNCSLIPQSGKHRAPRTSRTTKVQ